jgi:hypothetical protein
MALGCTPALAQSVSPDGGAISNDTGTLTTAAGTWSFGGPTPGRPGEWLILLNGSASNGGVSADLEVANGGQMYALTAFGSWWIWQNGSWTQTSAPVSPDGSAISNDTGTLATAAATWSFGGPAPGRPGEWLILLNGSANNGGVSAGLEVANGGQIYALTAYESWWIWNGSSWTETAAPPSPGASPDGTTISGGTGTLKTAAGTWSFGGPAPGRPGEYLILLNGNPTGGISASLEVANGGQLYALTAYGSWWDWTGTGWMETSAPPPPTAPPPTLTLTFNPQMPSIPASTPLGAVVATATAAWSNGAPFTGTLTFGAPYADDGGTFALSCTQCATANIVVNPVGLGVTGDGGSTQNITVTATQ